MNRFSKDIDTIDNTIGGKTIVFSTGYLSEHELSDSFRMLLMTFSNILGAVILIGIILPWFLIAVSAVSVAYVWAALFYQASARELKVRLYLFLHQLATNFAIATWYGFWSSYRHNCSNVLFRCSVTIIAVCSFL